jgi:hypothetical protein
MVRTGWVASALAKRLAVSASSIRVQGVITDWLSKNRC